MWLTPGRASARKNSVPILLLTLLKKECYKEEVQPYRKMKYKPMIYIYNGVCRLITYYLHISVLIMKFDLCNLNETNSFQIKLLFKYSVHAMSYIIRCIIASQCLVRI